MFAANGTSGNLSQWNYTQPATPEIPDWWTPFIAAVYLVICVGGLVGNGLVIGVVLRVVRVKSVTDVYIANLAVADLCFLVGLPFLASTMILRHWIFGSIMCRLFYILSSINWFTSVFTLTAMSADRYLAVCHPVRAILCRTPFVACVVCACIWFVSLLTMSPIVVYATTVPQTYNPARYSCTFRWPYGQHIAPDLAFMGYAFLLGFALPVPLISFFYALVVVRLRTVGPKRKSRDAVSSASAAPPRKHHKVTRLVFSVVAVYICCWLPYWIFQMALLFAEMPGWCRYIFQIITMLSYANSSLNPLLYAFLNHNFRSNFLLAFRCHKTAHAHGNDRMLRNSDRKRTNETRLPDRETSVRLASEREVSEVGTMTVLQARAVGDIRRKVLNNAREKSEETETRETIL